MENLIVIIFFISLNAEFKNIIPSLLKSLLLKSISLLKMISFLICLSIIFPKTEIDSFFGNFNLEIIFLIISQFLFSKCDNEYLSKLNTSFLFSFTS